MRSAEVNKWKRSIINGKCTVLLAMYVESKKRAKVLTIGIK